MDLSDSFETRNRSNESFLFRGFNTSSFQNHVCKPNWEQSDSKIKIRMFVELPQDLKPKGFRISVLHQSKNLAL